MKQEARKMPVCITGMHRSGTSMVARLLNLCSVNLGRAEDMVNPAPDNPEGYWENSRFLEIDTGLLNAFGGDWDLVPALPENWTSDPRVEPLRERAAALIKEFEADAPWGWKDPRAALVLPFWYDLLPDLRVLICLRNPLEVARSLYRRGYNSTAYSLALWRTYNENWMAASGGRKVLVTHQDAYFADAEAELCRVLDWLEIKAAPAIAAEACKSVSPALRHNRTTLQDLSDADASGRVLELYTRLCAAAGPVYARAVYSLPAPGAWNGGDNAEGARLPLEDVVRAQQDELERMQQERARLEQSYRDLEGWARQLETIVREQDRTLRRLGPVRALARLLGRGRKNL